MENLTLLCGVHHIAVHDGRLVITGRPSTGLKFFHANGRRYGFFRPPRSRTSASPPTETASSPAFEQARKTLKALGFRNDQVAETLAKLQTTPAPDLGDTPNYETIVRGALRDLRSGALVCREPANGYIVDDRAVRPTWAAQRRSG